jgi:hypothetical protein
MGRQCWWADRTVGVVPLARNGTISNWWLIVVISAVAAPCRCSPAPAGARTDAGPEDVPLSSWAWPLPPTTTAC